MEARPNEHVWKERLMRRLGFIAASIVLSLGADSARSQSAPAAPVPADWGVALREDARAFHDIIADSHPGPVDPMNPGFGDLLERGLRIAVSRAETADSYEDWYFALQEYAASFDDGHLSLSDHAPMGHTWRANWPGFLTALRNDAHEVVFSRDPNAPPVGATLASCDGRPANAFAADFVGRSAGRWNLRSRRAAYSTTLFVDQMNPYVRRPSSCVFRVNGVEKSFELAWRDLPNSVRDEGFAAGRSVRHTPPIGLRPFGEAGQWIGLASFEGDPASPAGRQLTALQAEVTAKAAAIRAAPRVVFDLRGNNGGSSRWINALAKTLWGEAHVNAKAPVSEGVDWRPSNKNLATIEGYKATLGEQPGAVRSLTEIAMGMRQARAAGRSLWRQGGGGHSAKAPEIPAPSAMTGRVYVLTDYGCASACLDAVDLLKALGAVHVGQETSADSFYMDVRGERLPSGRVKAYVPMKVYRGRARGNNESIVPVHTWTGALADTAGLERWILRLK
jgi:hypothetical protein